MNRELKKRVNRVLRDKSAPACEHGFKFITQCMICTPPDEKGEAQACDRLMKSLGWRKLSFSQFFKAAQTRGISDNRWYPPVWNPHGFLPFWFEAKRIGEHTNKEQLEGQSEFRKLVESCGEHYVRGGLLELAAHLREKKIAEVGIR